jgi:hypothetical protein
VLTASFPVDGVCAAENEGKHTSAGGKYANVGVAAHHLLVCRNCRAEWQVYCKLHPDHNGEGRKVNNKPRPKYLKVGCKVPADCSEPDCCVKGCWDSTSPRSFGRNACYTRVAYISVQPKASRSLEEGPHPGIPFVKPGGMPADAAVHHEAEVKALRQGVPK